MKATEGPSQARAGMLAALTRLDLPVYPGTVSGAEKAKRRAKNKAARAARKRNR